MLRIKYCVTQCTRNIFFILQKKIENIPIVDILPYKIILEHVKKIKMQALSLTMFQNGRKSREPQVF